MLTSRTALLGTLALVVIVIFLGPHLRFSGQGEPVPAVHEPPSPSNPSPSSPPETQDPDRSATGRVEASTLTRDRSPDDTGKSAETAKGSDERSVYFRERIGRSLDRIQEEPTLKRCHMAMCYVIAANIERRGVGTVIPMDQFQGAKIDIGKLQSGGDDLIQVDERMYTFAHGLFPEYTQLCAALGAGLEANTPSPIDYKDPHNAAELMARIIERANEALAMVN